MSKSDENKLPAELAQDFLSLQKEELEYKKQELVLREKEVDNSHEYSLKALDAQKGFFENLPSEHRKNRWQLLAIAVTLFIFIAAFFIYLLETGHSDFAYELMKYMAGAVFGGGAGYGIGYKRGTSKSESDEAQE